MEMINDALRYLTKKFYFNEQTYIVPNGTISQQRFYNLPPNVKNIINCTVTIGGILWTPKECSSRAEWDALHVMPFYQDFPSYFYVFNQQVGIFPDPASSGNTITINYKSRIPDLSMADVTYLSSFGTLSIITNTNMLTSSIPIFNQWMANGMSNANAWVRINSSITDSQNGDEQWYQIASITNGTTAILNNNYMGNSVTASISFIIGQVPILHEDYQDLPLYRMAYLYYTTRVSDPIRANLYEEKWRDGLDELNDEFGSKTTSVVLSDVDSPIVNPNLYVRSVS